MQFKSIKFLVFVIPIILATIKFIWNICIYMADNAYSALRFYVPEAAVYTNWIMQWPTSIYLS